MNRVKVPDGSLNSLFAPKESCFQSWKLLERRIEFVSDGICVFFSQQRLALGSSAIKVLGQNDTFVFWGSLQQLTFASQKVLWSVPQTVLYIGLTVSCGFLGNGCCFRKGSVEGSANFSLYLSPKWLLLHKSSLEGSASCALDLSPSLLLR